MDTTSLIHHWFDVEIPRGKFVEVSLILKEEFTWKWLHRFDVEISTWIRLSKSTKYRWILHVDFSMSFWHRIDVTSVLAVSILSFPNIFLLWEPILSYSVIVLSQCNFNGINVITAIGTIFFGNFATRQIKRNKDNFIFFKITLSKIIMSIFINKNNIYLFQNNTNQNF